MFEVLLDEVYYLLLGLATTAGTSAAILGTIGAGFFVEWFGSFRGFLWLTSCLYFLSALFWNLFSTGELVDFDASSKCYTSVFDSLSMFLFFTFSVIVDFYCNVVIQ